MEEIIHLNVSPGELVRGIVKYGKRPSHINVKMSLDEFDTFLKSSESERREFLKWIRSMVIPAMREENSKLTIELIG